MYRHARNNMLTQNFDYQMSKEDIKAFQHNWTQSMRESKKLSTFEAGAKMVINGQRIR